MIKLCLSDYKKHSLRKANEDLLFSFHMFICQIAVHSLEFASEPLQDMAPAIALYSLRYLKKVCKSRCTDQRSPSKLSDVDAQKNKDLAATRGILRYYKFLFYSDD